MYSPEIADRVPTMLRVMCGFFVFFVLVGILTVKRNKNLIIREKDVHISDT